MKPFTYTRATTTSGAVQAFGALLNTKFLAGGTNLIDLMKMGVEQRADTAQNPAWLGPETKKVQELGSGA